MAPLTPLGKPLSRAPLVSQEVPFSASSQTGTEQPISAFQWVSLARASWTWILRPLWYLCFKWPTQLFIAGTTTSTRSGDTGRKPWQKRHSQQQQNEMTRSMVRNMNQDR